MVKAANDCPTETRAFWDTSTFVFTPDSRARTSAELHDPQTFAGFDTKTVAGVTRDYLNLEYAGTDKVFLPVDQPARGRAMRTPRPTSL